MTIDHQHDVLIIGSGAAGLSLALRLDERLKIAVISKRELEETNTYYAQGGISVVLDEMDTVASHVKDTLNAGAGLCDEATVQLVVENGPSNIEWLLKGGVNFTKDETSSSSGGYHLTREGGHSHRRVIHAADATGKEVESTL
jgi:L-aspartate oxidase